MYCLLNKPTATPTPIPTATPVPTATPAPTATPVPTATPEVTETDVTPAAVRSYVIPLIIGSAVVLMGGVMLYFRKRR